MIHYGRNTAEADTAACVSALRLVCRQWSRAVSRCFDGCLDLASVQPNHCVAAFPNVKCLSLEYAALHDAVDDFALPQLLGRLTNLTQLTLGPLRCGVEALLRVAT